MQQPIETGIQPENMISRQVEIRLTMDRESIIFHRNGKLVGQVRLNPDGTWMASLWIDDQTAILPSLASREQATGIVVTLSSINFSKEEWVAFRGNSDVQLDAVEASTLIQRWFVGRG